MCIFLDNYITFNTLIDINTISSSCSMFIIRMLASIRRFLSQKDCETLVHSFISPRLDSCNASSLVSVELTYQSLKKYKMPQSD